MTNIGNLESHPLGEEIAKIFQTDIAKRLSAFGCILAGKVFVSKGIVQCHIFNAIRCYLRKREVLGRNKQ